jgi:hypothetical protein
VENPYQGEAQQRWGHTDAYRESQRRTSRYSKADWEAIQAEGQAYTLALADLIARDPADSAVQAQIARHHKLIDERFYPCPPDLFRALGEGYVADERFTAFYDRVKPGLAPFMRDAMAVYADALAEKLALAP